LPALWTPSRDREAPKRETTTHQWQTPVIPATQEAEIRRIAVRSQPGQIAQETLSRKKPITKKGLVEWLKVKALSSSLSPAKKKKKERERKK
jgi:hypothetical protein